MLRMLRIDASLRLTGSLSRQLADQFSSSWSSRGRELGTIHRDVGRSPPPYIDESFVKAAFTPSHLRGAAEQDALAHSDVLLAELRETDVIVVSTPMYNYGVPAGLKSWMDQVARLGETFSFDLARGDVPIRPLPTAPAMVVLSARGEFGFGPGELREGMDHLTPHLRTFARFLGVEFFRHVGIEYQEMKDDRHARSIAEARAALPGLIDELEDFFAERASARALCDSPPAPTAL